MAKLTMPLHMQVMKEHDDNRKLGNIVQLDDAYIGGKQKGT